MKDEEIREEFAQQKAAQLLETEWRAMEEYTNASKLRTISDVCDLPPGSFVKHLDESKASSMSHEERSMMPTPASYGEPWSKQHYKSPIGDTGDYDGVIEIYTKDNAMRVAEAWNPEDENERAFDRIVSCVNACQGIADPVEAIRAAKEALEDAAEIAEGMCARYESKKFRDALAKLNNTAP